MNNKVLSLTLSLFICIVGVLGQDINNQPSIDGYLKSCNDKKIYILYENIKDSVQTNKDGYFYYSTPNIVKASIITLSLPNNINSRFYFAPGFKITISANIQSPESFYNSLKVSGIGSITNQFYKYDYLLSKTWIIKPLYNQWYDIKFSSFAKEGIQKLGLDSFANFVSDSIFSSRNIEPYHETFKRLSIADCNLKKLFYLFAYSGFNDLSLAQIDTLLQECIDKKFLNNLINDEYFPLFNYGEVITFSYLNYLVSKETIKNPEEQVNPLRLKLKIVDSLYTGDSKTYSLHHIIKKHIPAIYSLSELESIFPFILKVNDSELQRSLVKSYEERKIELNTVNIGKPAPVFNLPDMNGKMFSLTDSKGKVIYIDLWASWCGPCKEEIPYLKKIVDEYSNSDNVQFISIAVHDADGKEKRKKLEEQLNLKWLQLEDKNDLVYKNYKITYIPRFILIDKMGNILDFDAPRPSNRDVLIKALNKAIKN